MTDWHSPRAHRLARVMNTFEDQSEGPLLCWEEKQAVNFLLFSFMHRDSPNSTALDILTLSDLKEVIMRKIKLVET